MQCINTVAANNSFSLFGMTTSDSINVIIAAFAVLGFIASLTISVFTLIQNKKSTQKQNDINMFDKRVELLNYFLSLFVLSDWYNSKPDIKELSLNSVRVKYLFKNSSGFLKLLNQLIEYYRDKKQLPDYSSEYLGQLKNKDNVIVIAFKLKAVDYLLAIEKDLYLCN